jgi:hypothetical protein
LVLENRACYGKKRPPAKPLFSFAAKLPPDVGNGCIRRPDGAVWPCRLALPEYSTASVKQRGAKVGNVNAKEV